MILGWTGRVGSGKTYSMVAYALKYRGRRAIYANTPEISFAEPFSTWEELLDLHSGLVLLDELPIWAAARDWGKLSPDVASFFAQSRKNGVHLLFTAQAFAGVDAVIRRLTAQLYRCERFGPLIREDCVDGVSGERMGRRWRFISRAVYQHYDTFAVVGDGEGSGARLGWVEIDRAAATAGALVERGYVRVEVVGGGVRYERARVEDAVSRWADLVLPGDRGGVRVAALKKVLEWHEVEVLASIRGEGGAVGKPKAATVPTVWCSRWKEKPGRRRLLQSADRPGRG